MKRSTSFPEFRPAFVGINVSRWSKSQSKSLLPVWAMVEQLQAAPFLRELLAAIAN